MGESNLDYFLEEWLLPSKPVTEGKGIQYLKAYKIFDYIELMEDKDFIDIRVDFDGIGSDDELYNLEFLPLNEIKDIPMVLVDNISIYRTVSNIKGEELF